MSEDRPNLLPKGIVVNAPRAEQSIERNPGEPVDEADIERMWKVYTTTQRRLLDPTAIRLEHFWWRIWGSKRRELSASTIAAAYTHISHGETFMPLRGPANRDESVSRTTNSVDTGAGPSHKRPTLALEDSRPSTESSVSTSKIPAVSPLPPILKKPDAPPTSGPRPSVGFASPASSEVEADDEVEEGSSNSTRSQGMVEVAPTNSQISKPERKGKKKSQPFVASRGKKRPMMVRRTSSKSSSEFKGGLPQSDATSPSSESSLVVEPAAKGKGKERAVTVSKFQENFSISPEKLLKKPKATKPANGKGRPKVKEHYEQSRENTFTDGVDLATPNRVKQRSSSSNGDPGPSTLQNIQNSQVATAKEDLAFADLEEFEMQKAMFKDFERQRREREAASSRGQPPGLKQSSSGDDLDLEVSPSSRPPQRPKHSVIAEKIETPNSRSGPGVAVPKTDNTEILHEVKKDRRGGENSDKANPRAQPEAAEARDHSSKAPTRGQPPKTKSSATSSQTHTTATGKLGLGSEGPSTSTHSAEKGKTKGKPDDMFAKRPIPSLPTGPSGLSASVPGTMARSKSQLSLLLEKDRARSGEKEQDRDGKKKGGK